MAKNGWKWIQRIDAATSLCAALGGLAFLQFLQMIFTAFKQPSPPWWVHGIAVFICAGAMALLLFRPAKKSKTASKLKVHSAFYGIPENDVAVTQILQQHRGDALSVWIGNNLIPGIPDPAPNVKKRLVVEYSYGNQPRRTVSRPEHTLLVLPEDPWSQKEIEQLKAEVRTQPKEPAPTNVGGPSIESDFVDLTVDSAEYGSDVKRVDVAQRVREILSTPLPEIGFPSLFVNTKVLMGEVKHPHEQSYKYLLITFSGKLHEGKNLYLRGLRLK